MSHWILKVAALAVTSFASSFTSAFAGSLLDSCKLLPENYVQLIDENRSKSVFVGTWEGSWGSKKELAQTLLVIWVNGEEAVGFYAYGNSKAWSISAGCERYRGVIEGGVLTVKWPRTPIKIEYKHNGKKGKKEGLSSKWEDGTNKSSGIVYRGAVK
jgi:hypothetical protein